MTDPDFTLMTEVVDILFKLREIDTTKIDKILAMSQLAEGLLPEPMAKALKLMLIDLVLIKTFAEAAKQYNYTEEHKQALKDLFKPTDN